ncbi:MAG: hypothetical protein AAFQ23_07915 [Cyanobacteria bacterium J06623_1]
MGCQPYYYFCKYQKNISAALQDLCQREFKAGRYEPAMDDAGQSMSSFTFPPDKQSVSPGARHASIEEACNAADEEGTQSILDIQKVTDSAEFMASSPLPTDFLLRFFKTDKPTRELVERVIVREEPLTEGDLDSLDAWDDFADSVETPGGSHFIVYENDQPSEIFFMGYIVN